MSSLSEYARNELVDHLLKVGAFTQPSNIYVALFDGDPEDSGTELSGNSYARVQHNAWNAASSGQSTNDGTVTFPQATAAWDEATHAALYDASTSGNRLVSGALDEPVTVGLGEIARFSAGQITVGIEA